MTTTWPAGPPWVKIGAMAPHRRMRKMPSCTSPFQAWDPVLVCFWLKLLRRAVGTAEEVHVCDDIPDEPWWRRHPGSSGISSQTRTSRYTPKGSLPSMPQKSRLPERVLRWNYMGRTVEGFCVGIQGVLTRGQDDSANRSILTSADVDQQKNPVGCQYHIYHK